jgi:hypothetical protein
LKITKNNKNPLDRRIKMYNESCLIMSIGLIGWIVYMKWGKEENMKWKLIRISSSIIMAVGITRLILQMKG